MSYMNHNELQDNKIVQLSLAEIDDVNGGVAPLIAVAYVGIALSVTVLAAGSAFVAGVQTGYDVNKD
ncbi:MAG: hypothetical protein C0511_19210 [Hyphomicrobium sp.]|nr:hypothetical protein [Hyphomicrobium sp.]